MIIIFFRLGHLSPVFEVPNQIVFPATKIGVQSIRPASMDKEYLSYVHKELGASPYSIRISLSEFTSTNGNVMKTNSVWSGIKKVAEDGTVEKTFDDVLLTSAPVKLIGVSETKKEIFSKLELSKNGLELFIPIDVKISGSVPETFSAEMIWEVSYTP